MVLTQKQVVMLFRVIQAFYHLGHINIWIPLYVQGFANELSTEVKTLGIPAEVIDMKDYDPDDQLADEVREVQRGGPLSFHCQSTGEGFFFFSMREIIKGATYKIRLQFKEIVPCKFNMIN